MGSLFFVFLPIYVVWTPSYSTETKSKHLRDFEQFFCGFYNRKNAEQHWQVTRWPFQVSYG